MLATAYQQLEGVDQEIETYRSVIEVDETDGDIRVYHSNQYRQEVSMSADEVESLLE